MTEMGKHLSDACLWVRVMLGLNRIQMAQRMNLCKRSIETAERGHATLRTIERYREVTGVDVYLLASVMFAKAIEVPGLVEQAESVLRGMSNN